MVRDIERISRETTLDGSCPGCGSPDYFPALVRDARGDLNLGAHCDDSSFTEVLA